MTLTESDGATKELVAAKRLRQIGSSGETVTPDFSGQVADIFG